MVPGVEITEGAKRADAGNGAPAAPARNLIEKLRSSATGVSASLLLAVLAYLSSATGALSQIRGFMGWESVSDGVREADSALEVLNKGDHEATQMWSIDRLVMVANTHSGLRPLIAERLADFIREQAVSSGTKHRSLPIERMESATDSANEALLDGLKVPAAEYALRTLGRPPFVGVKRLDDQRLDLRDIVIPQFRSRHEVYRDIDFSGDTLFKSSLGGTRFENCTLAGCVFSRSRMVDCRITNCGVHGARFVEVETNGSLDLRRLQAQGAIVAVRGPSP